MRNSGVVVASAVLILSSSSCRSRPPSELGSTASGAKQSLETFVPPRPEHPKLCAALRGNGNYVFTLWASLARIVEHYGMIEGVVGGSSAGITTFLYESIYANPAIWICGNNNRLCSEEETAIRAGLLLKTLKPFSEMTANHAGGKALQIGPSLVKEYKEKGVSSLIASGDWIRAASAIDQILRASELEGLVSRKFLSRLWDAGERKFAVKEFKEGVDALSWDPKGVNIFLRSNIVDFQVFGKRITGFGDFYAGRNQRSLKRQKMFLDACAVKQQVGKLWKDIAPSPGPMALSTEKDDVVTGTQLTCGDAFTQATKDFLSEAYPKEKIFRDAEEYVSQRGQDSVGKYMPVFVMTSVLEGRSINDQYLSSYFLYQNGRSPTRVTDTFDNVKTGFWAKDADLSRTLVKPNYAADPMTSRYIGLGETAWKDIVTIGGQEPGLGPVMCHINYGEHGSQQWGSFDEVQARGKGCLRSSAGAWMNHNAMPLLKGAGCERVIYVTRQGKEGDFIVGVAKLLGATTQDINDLYALDNPDSGVQKSFDYSDATWCTNWNDIEASDLNRMNDHSYLEANMLSDDPFFLQGKFADIGKYPHSYSHKNRPLPGCTQGIAEKK